MFLDEIENKIIDQIAVIKSKNDEPNKIEHSCFMERLQLSQISKQYIDQANVETQNTLIRLKCKYIKMIQTLLKCFHVYDYYHTEVTEGFDLIKRESDRMETNLKQFNVNCKNYLQEVKDKNMVFSIAKIISFFEYGIEESTLNSLMLYDKVLQNLYEELSVNKKEYEEIIKKLFKDQNINRLNEQYQTIHAMLVETNIKQNNKIQDLETKWDMIKEIFLSMLAEFLATDVTTTETIKNLFFKVIDYIRNLNLLENKKHLNVFPSMMKKVVQDSVQELFNNIIINAAYMLLSNQHAVPHHEIVDKIQNYNKEYPQYMEKIITLWCELKKNEKIYNFLYDVVNNILKNNDALITQVNDMRDQWLHRNLFNVNENLDFQSKLMKNNEFENNSKCNKKILYEIDSLIKKMNEIVKQNTLPLNSNNDTLINVDDEEEYYDVISEPDEESHPTNSKLQASETVTMTNITKDADANNSINIPLGEIPLDQFGKTTIEHEFGQQGKIKKKGIKHAKQPYHIHGHKPN